MCPSMSAFRTTLAFALVMSASLAFGQIDSNAVTVTASRNANLQPDQVLFGVGVTSGLNVSLDDVVAALAGSGITVANFSSVIPEPASAATTGSGITVANFSSVSSQQGIPAFNPGSV